MTATPGYEKRASHYRSLKAKESLAYLLQRKSKILFVKNHSLLQAAMFYLEELFMWLKSEEEILKLYVLP